MCSSEDEAQAARALIGGAYIPTACAGPVSTADLTPLKGRKGLLIPANTPDCITEMRQLASRLHGLGCALRWTDTASEPIDWELTAWTGTSAEFVEWAKARTADYVPPPEPPKPVRVRPQLITIDGNTALQPALAAAPASMSEDALADHFADQHGENWRHVKEWGQWLECAGDRWREEKTSKAERLAIEVTRESLTWAEAGQLTPKERRQINKKATAWAVRDMAATDRRIAAITDQWDLNPWLLGVPGGVLDLESGAMLEPNREQYITKQCTVAPANGTPQRWLEFLNRVTDDNEPLIQFLHRCAGYWLTGQTREHSLTFLYGTGANGKSVFMRTLGGILGVEAQQYAASCQMTVFVESRVERHSTELARLRGARLVMAEETAGGAKWVQAKIQWLTGEGSVTARFMRQDDFTFKPCFKLLFAGNHKPMLRSVDEAIKRRFHLVPFTVTIPESERDLQLFDKLREEWPQILGWMVDGCTEWQRMGLRVPDVIRDATNTYLETEDALGQWLDECCERKDRETGEKLFNSYRDWCEKNGEHAWSRRAWSSAIVERNFILKKGTAGVRMIDGLSLKTAYPSAPPYQN